ncbi:DUF4097 family beta strand repeat-containing protein [Saccharothrix sp. Mg75]|uniref:DUF4097 family beta strand repeat-containing protein n=1 Tax=Saccharothrix sp. Mg75 TaxID=3445357 RepID=UPI003EEA4AA2
MRRTGDSAIVKVVGGAIRIGDGDGELHLSTAGGDITVDRVGTGLTAKSASGDIRVGRATTGEVELLTGSGEVEIGIGEGVAAWVDARSRNGSVRNSLDSLESPADRDDVVKVRIRTRQGDVMIHRSTNPGSATRS